MISIITIALCILTFVLLITTLLILAYHLKEKQRAVFELREETIKNQKGAKALKLVILGEFILVCVTFGLEMLPHINLARMFMVEKVVCIVFLITVFLYIQLYWKSRNH